MKGRQSALGNGTILEKPNIILIVIDTLRRDAVGIYSGNNRTPNIDLLAADGVVYPNAITPYSWTVPSHLSLFTGKYLEKMGLREENLSSPNNVRAAISQVRIPFMAEKLSSMGYDTIGFSANELVSPNTGFDRGFRYFLRQHYVEHWDPLLEAELSTVRKKYLGSNFQIAWELVRKGKVFELMRLFGLGRARKRYISNSQFPEKKGASRIVELVSNASFEKPFFLFLNLMEVHEPYKSTFGRDEVYLGLMGLLHCKKISQWTLSRIRRDYQGEIEIVDRYLGALFSDLKRRGVYGDTLIILTSDHGQSLGEHGFLGHGTFLFDELLRVPLIVKYPHGAKPPLTDGYQSTIDVYDFVSKAASMDPAMSFPSRELAYASSCGLNPFWKDAYAAISERYSTSVPDFMTASKRFFAKRTALFHSGYKAIAGREPPLEELTLDGVKLDAEDTELGERLRTKIIQFEESLKMDVAGEFDVDKSRTATADDEEVINERLRLLGYT